MAKTSKNTPKSSPKNAVQPGKKVTYLSFPASSPLVIAMAIVCCTYTIRVMDPVLIPKFLGYSIFVFTLFVGLWAKGKLTDLMELFFKNPFLWVCLAFIGISGTVGISVASMLGDALLEWGKWALGVLGMWGIVAYYRKNTAFRSLLCQSVSLFTLIVCAFALSDVSKLLANNNLTHSTSYSINSLFGHKNIFSEVLFLMLPFNLYAVFYKKNIARLLAIFASIISLIFMIALLSRAVWISLALSSAITGTLYFIIEFWGKRQSQAQLKKMGLITVMGIALVASSLGLYAALSKGDAIQKQWSSITNIQHSANQDRLKKWQQTWELFDKQPLTGVGIGDWKIEILQFITKNSEIEGGKLFFQRPHNDYLWVLSEMGIFSFIAYLSIFGTALFMIFRLIRQTENSATRNWYYLLLSGILGYLIFSFFSFPKERMEEIFFLHLIFAAVLQEYDLFFYTETKPQKGKYIAPILSLFIAGTCIYVGYERFQGECELRKFDGYNKAGQYDLALENVLKAYRPMFEMDPISTPIRFFSGTLYLQMGKYDLAKAHLEEAHHLSPYHVQVMNNLAGLYFVTKETKKARELYEKVLLFAPKYEDALLSLTAIYYNNADFEKSFSAICQVDTISQTPKYRQYLKDVSEKMKLSILSTITEPLLTEQISQVFTQKIGYMELPLRAKNQGRSIAQQVVKEAIINLTKTQKINEIEADRLRKKYGI